MSKETDEEVYEKLQKRIAISVDPDNMRMTPREASVYIPAGESYLAQLRFVGQGPKFLKPSRNKVLYRKRDIDEWLESSVHQSTAEGF